MWRNFNLFCRRYFNNFRWAYLCLFNFNFFRKFNCFCRRYLHFLCRRYFCLFWWRSFNNFGRTDLALFNCCDLYLFGDLNWLCRRCLRFPWNSNWFRWRKFWLFSLFRSLDYIWRWNLNFFRRRRLNFFRRWSLNLFRWTGLNFFRWSWFNLFRCLFYNFLILLRSNFTFLFNDLNNNRIFFDCFFFDAFLLNWFLILFQLFQNRCLFCSFRNFARNSDKIIIMSNTNKFLWSYLFASNSKSFRFWSFFSDGLVRSEHFVSLSNFNIIFYWAFHIFYWIFGLIVGIVFEVDLLYFSKTADWLSVWA